MGFGWPIAGPEGYRGGTYPQPLAVQDQLIGTLCARIDLGKAFKVGSQLYLQEVQRDGELQFICNDSVGYSFDNWGQVLVTVLVKRKTSGRELTGKVSCDLRIIDVSKGSGIASAGGETASNKIDLLARGLAGKLKESMVIKGEPIAVVSLRNRSRTNQGKIIADELADKVQGALIDTGWFDVKERIDLRAVLDEKDLDTAGIVKNDSVRKKLSGVKYIVIGGVTVTEPPKQ